MRKLMNKSVALWALVVSCVTMGALIVPALAGATGLDEAFDPKTTSEELITKLGPVGVAVVAIFVAVFLFTVGLHFFRRHGKSVAK